MGYTHYWTWQEGQWSDEASKARSLALDDMIKLARHGMRGKIICGPHGKGRPALDQNEFGSPMHISFNGCGDDDYETFWFPGEWGFNFCKTNQKPYDAYVVACLLVARARFPARVLRITSDGGPTDWAEGAALYRAVLKKKPPSLAFLEKE